MAAVEWRSLYTVKVPACDCAKQNDQSHTGQRDALYLQVRHGMHDTAPIVGSVDPERGNRRLREVREVIGARRAREEVLAKSEMRRAP